jgi:Tol biopolymer transport system component
LLPTGAGESKALPNPGIEVYYSGAWFPDGKRILLAGEQSDRIPRSFVQDVDGGPPQPVGPEGMRAVLVSPGGDRVAAYGPDGEVYLMSADGAEPEPIAGTEFGDELLQWSADGGGLYVRALDDSRLEIYRLDLATGIRQTWVELDIPDPIGFIGIENGPGATRITPDGSAVVYSYWQGRGELYIAEGLR